MKKIKLLIFCLPLAFIFHGCKEVNDLIDLTPPQGIYDQLVLDSTFTSAIPTPQSKNVLIEDFTGDRCDNCPRAQNTGVMMVDANPGRVSVVGIQATGLDSPYIQSFRLTTAYGDKLLGIEGSYPGLPVGDVDRKLYSGNTSNLMTDALWAGNVSTELDSPTIANIDIATNGKSYDSVSRIFSLTVNVTFTKTSTDTFYFSAALTESGMKGPQLMPPIQQSLFPPDGVNDTFTFQHVLRNMMQPWNGLQIATAPAAGKVYQIKFSTILNSKWVANNCKVVAFVHHRGIKNNVEQVMETTIK